MPTGRDAHGHTKYRGIALLSLRLSDVSFSPIALSSPSSTRVDCVCIRVPLRPIPGTTVRHSRSSRPISPVTSNLSFVSDEILFWVSRSSAHIPSADHCDSLVSVETLSTPFPLHWQGCALSSINTSQPFSYLGTVLGSICRYLHGQHEKRHSHS